jgi:hypothetical protein
VAHRDRRAKALHKAVVEVFGAHALTQRCREHEKRKVTDALPERLRGSIRSAMNQAYATRDPKRARRLRVILRHRERLVEYAASHIQHMQKALMQMNVQLRHVVTDITGVTGLRIVRAICAGERDPPILAQFRDTRCKSSTDVIRAALTGHYRSEHVFALR